MSLLRTDSLSKNFAGLNAVSNIDFELQRGQTRALIGPNGAGKTTFVSLLSGRIPTSSGSIYFDGVDITNKPAHTRIRLGMAYTFQITSVFARLTVHENVALAAQARNRSSASQVNENVIKALDTVGLLDYVSQLAGAMSYGHQRLLEIAMGLVQAPKLFILDEPTQGLAESEIQSFIKLISSFSSETTVLLIEHNMDVVMAAADQITVLDFGEILAEGTPAEIRANDAVQAAYLGTN